MRVKNRKQLAALASQGEGEALEFKRSTGELKEAMQTLCAFMNGFLFVMTDKPAWNPKRRKNANQKREPVYENR